MTMRRCEPWDDDGGRDAMAVSHSERSSTILIPGQGEHRPVQLHVTVGPDGALVWIDDPNGDAIANLRLTVQDAKHLIGWLASALNPEVYGEVR